MNKDKINYYNLQGRKDDLESLERLKKTTKNESNTLEIKTENIDSKIELSKLADDSLKSIQQDMCVRLSRFSTEAFEIKSQIKKIDRILKLRKAPIIDD